MNDCPVPAILNDLLSMNADVEGCGGISTCLPCLPAGRFDTSERTVQAVSNCSNGLNRLLFIELLCSLKKVPVIYEA